MSGYLTEIEIADPHLIPQSIWENFPARQKILLTEHEFSSQEWAPLDRRRFRLEPESYRTELSFANLGALHLSRSAGSQALRMTTRLPAVDGFGISMIERGTSGLVFPGMDEPAAANATMGYIFNLEHGLRATESDGHCRRFLRLPAELLCQKLEALPRWAESPIYRVPSDVRSDARRRGHDPPHVRLRVRGVRTFRYAVDE